MRLASLTTLIVLLLAANCYAAGSTDGANIVNKANLPPARLAEAIAAKAIVLDAIPDEQKRLLLLTANTDPYSQAAVQAIDGEGQCHR